MGLKQRRRRHIHLFTTNLAGGSQRRRRRGQCWRQHAVGVVRLPPGAEQDAVEDAEDAPPEQGNAVVKASPYGGGAVDSPARLGHVLF